MTNQEILNTLSGLEAALYYRADGSDDRENISFSDCQTARDMINEVLVFWHNVTGLTID